MPIGDVLRQASLEVDDDAAGGLGADPRRGTDALDVAVGDGLPDGVAGKAGQQRQRPPFGPTPETPISRWKSRSSSVVAKP